MQYHTTFSELPDFSSAVILCPIPYLPARWLLLAMARTGHKVSFDMELGVQSAVSYLES